MDEIHDHGYSMTNIWINMVNKIHKWIVLIWKIPLKMDCLSPMESNHSNYHS